MAVIKFLCPNGHPLSASPERSGKSGQCPRCQARFVVPKVEVGLPGQEVIDAAHQTAEPVASESSAARGDDESFAFLCPNGHKLHGPASLQGKPGQCPHCKSRFLIPNLHGAERQEAETTSAYDVVTAPWDATASWQLACAGPLPTEGDDDAPDGDALDEARVCVEPPSPPGPTGGHPLAEIVRTLCADAPHEVQLEVLTADGTVLAAESFAPALSHFGYGVFGGSGDQGDRWVTILPWSDVRRIVVRGLGELPRAWFAVAATNRRAPGRPP